MSSRALMMFFAVATVLPAEDYSHRVYRTEDGLPQNRIQAIAQTSEGYLWVGTSEGLARFDGTRFVVFDRANTAAFKDNSILSLVSAPDGSLWIGTEGGGLLHYANGGFQTYGQSEGISNGFVRALGLDRAGVLWVGTDRGFFRFSDGRFTRLDNTPDIPLASVLALAEDVSGKMWVASSSGLLTIEQGKLVRASCQASGMTPRMMVSLVHEGLAKSGCEIPELPLPDVDINSMRMDSSGNLWIGTLGQGLLELHNGAVTSFTAPSVLPENTVFVVFEDRQHDIWVGGLDGLVRLAQTAVTTLSTRNGLADENVVTTYADRAGEIWLATFSGQIYRLKGKIPERYDLGSFGHDVKVRTIFEDSEGGYWFGTGGAGVLRRTASGTIRYTKNEGLRSNTIRQILEGLDGTIWIATGSGISRWDGKGFTNYYLEDGLSYPSVRVLVLDANGDILAGTDAGLNRIHNGRIIPDLAFAELKQERIWSILVDNGSLWLGTRGHGLVRVKSGKVSRLTSRDGLASNSVYQIVNDGKGRFWMSSPAGVFSVTREELDNVADGTVKSLNSVAYGTSDGMATSQMSGGVQPAGCRGPSGNIWFPSVSGAVRIDPDHLPKPQLAPVLIERVTAGGIAILSSQEAVFPPGHGKLQIDYTACNLIGPQRVSFLYKLEGFDDQWTVAAKSRSADYSNLPPGHYRFRVIAADSSAPDITSEASIAIYLKPAFHQTAAFYFLCLAAIIGTAGAGLWLYTRQTKTRFTLLFKERTRLAREMHDTVIQGCIGVSTLLEAAARCQKTDVNEAGYLLDHARAEVKATIAEARQAVWDLRHSFGEGSAVSHLFELARKFGVQHGMEIDTAVEGTNVPLDPATAHTMLLVGREALRNAVMHGEAGRIAVNIVFETARVRVEVWDNGKGFDPGAEPDSSRNHFGIVGMRERVEQLGGQLILRSQPGEGTTVIASLPLPENGWNPDREIQNRPARV